MLAMVFSPSPNSTNICDPFQSYDILQIMSNEIPHALCSHCLPDCKSTDYQAKVFVNPFVQCNEKNVGGSKFDFKHVSPLQEKLKGQILDEYQLQTLNGFYETGSSYIDFLFEVSDDSFVRDIAVVKIMHESPTSVQMTTSKLSMNWVHYFSTVGGLLR